MGRSHQGTHIVGQIAATRVTQEGAGAAWRAPIARG